MMTSAQVVETSVTVTDNSPFQDYPHPNDHTTRLTVTPGFKPFTVLSSDMWATLLMCSPDVINEMHAQYELSIWAISKVDGLYGA